MTRLYLIAAYLPYRCWRKTGMGILLLLCYAAVAKAQPSLLSDAVKTIAGAYHSFAVDNMNNLYLFTTTQQLKKLNAQGDSVAVFNNIKKWGEASLIDVSNPVKILLYYKNFATIVLLDGMLEIKNTLDLRRKGLFTVPVAGLSYDGKIWLYDEVENNLKKTDEEGTVLLKTPDLRQVLEEPLQPQYLIDQNRYVYLYDAQQGLLVFDYYGTLKNTIHLTGWSFLKIIGNTLYGLCRGKLCSYNMLSHQQQEWPLPASTGTCRQLLVTDKYVYILNNEGLQLFALKP